MAKIPRFILDSGDGIKPILIGEQPIQCALLIFSNERAEYLGYQLAFKGEGTADNVLEKSVTGQDYSLVAQMVDELAQHIDRAAGDARCADGMRFESNPLFTPTKPIAK